MPTDLTFGHSGPRRNSQIARKPAQVPRDRSGRLVLHPAIVPDQLASERSDPRPTPAPASDRGQHYRLREARVQRLHKLPCPSIGHAHGARRGGNRAALMNMRHQRCLSGADRRRRFRKNPKRETGIAGHALNFTAGHAGAGTPISPAPARSEKTAAHHLSGTRRWLFVPPARQSTQ